MSENERGSRAAGGRSRGAKTVGVIACVFGLALAALSFVIIFLGEGASIAPEAMGAMLGVLGYALGARKLGLATIIICIVALVLGLAAAQGIIPGLEPMDRQIRPN